MKISTKILLSISLLYFIGCKEAPNYNPFDDQFDINVNRLIKDKCDTINTGCGYWNLQENSGRLRTYYQIYADDWRKVVAKGFSYYVDIQRIDTYKLKHTEIDSILYQQIDTKILNKELEKYKFRFLKLEQNKVYINKGKDTLELEFYYKIQKDSIRRYLSYFNNPEVKNIN